jgi:hypothetical protein
MVDVTAVDVTPIAKTEADTSFVQWGAVFAGAVMAAALSFVLLTFGTSIGLSFVSPWPGAGASATLIASLAAFWTLAQYIGSFMVGGYIAGRMRAPRPDTPDDEVEFRDGLHGGLVWAVGIVIGAGLLFTATGVTTRAATEVGARAAAATTQTTDPAAYAVDTMLRSTRPAGAAGATQPTTPEQRAEVGRILTRSLTTGLSEPDKTYLASLVADRTGISQQDAERRITDAMNATRDAADKARRAAIVTGLVTAIGLLVALGAAWWAAMRGGQHRDQSIPARFPIGRHRSA